MIVPGSLWVACTVAAAAGQTLRNAMQHSLIGTVGTAGATHVRFLYGLPFACVFLAVVASTGAIRNPQMGPAFWAWLTLGALTQVLATAMMLVLMQQRSFVVSTAYIKTEPVQIALYGFVFLGDRLGLQAIVGVLVATAGVVLMSWRRAPADAVPVAGARASMWRAALLGIATGSMFSLSVVGYRGAVLALGDDPFYGRATLALVLALALQTVLLSLYLRVREPGRLTGLVRAWKPSLLAGLLGATASQFWFLAFSLQTAAAVRTVGLVEVVFAALISRRLFAQQGSAREWGGIAMVVCGVALLLAGTF
ncbi:MAG: DMT family transporter [Burkholderiales bacterium]|nr:DMT family transporter [Burkholderiales bacterium]